MLKNRRLAKQISASGWAEFFTFLDYKASWYGKSVIEIGRFDPSSKTCHSCGFVNKDLKLKDRMWTCPRCGDRLDRDINAALNIKAFALLHKNLIVPRDTRELTPEEIAGYGGR
jgi:putative transposase